MNDDLAVAELRVICGPTAAGKSALAMRLAERHDLEIVCADSRQIYRGFDIGTAKPNATECARVRHHCIDVAEPVERWSAARWSDDARRSIDRIGVSRTLVVGGTGFYLRALVAPLFESPVLDPVRRADLATSLDELPTNELARWVRALDAPCAHLGRTQLLRAVEVALLTGVRLSDLQRTGSRPGAFRARWLVVDPLRRLGALIEQRLDEMLTSGWLDEVRALEARVPPEAPAWQACGYGVARDLLLGKMDASRARETRLIATRQYAKRQRTWFRHQIADAELVTIVNPLEADCETRVENWWTSGDSA